MLVPFALAATIACSDDDTGPQPAAAVDTSAATDTAAEPTHTGTVDTGTRDACPAEVARLSRTVCVESTASASTASASTSDGYTTHLDTEGIVVEVGAALAPVPASLPAAGFPACAADHPHQVRLVDGDGETWTLGIDLAGPVDDASTAAIVPGAEVSVHAVRTETWVGFDEALVLSDAGGPLLLLEDAVLLTDAERGMSVGFPETTCAATEQGVAWLYLPVSFVGTTSIEVWPGQTGTVDLGARQLDVAVGDWSLIDPCPSDWCGARWWAAWAR